MGILLILGLVPRLKLNPQLQSDAAAAKSAVPSVNVVALTRAPSTVKLDLPGTIEGADQTAISARASGYLRKWYVDLGDHVKQGQTLAVIETPDQDQNVAQAKAVLIGSDASAEQARANYFTTVANAEQAEANVSKAQAAVQQARSDLAHSQVAEEQTREQSDQQAATLNAAIATTNQAKVTSDRYTSLAQQGAVDQQTADQDRAVYQTDLANVESLRSALRASRTNIRAARETTLSSQANLKSMFDSVAAARAAVAAAKANERASAANEAAARATILANKANLNRNTVLQGFDKVVAPFDGVITARNVEVGSLVSPTGGVTATTGSTGFTTSAATAASNSANQSLFTMVRTSTVRVFVNVPQQFSGALRTGQTVRLAAAGGKPITGIINRDASVLDPGSRTLLAQVDVPNHDERLRPGMFVTVSITLPQAAAGWRIPDTALIVDAEGDRVATVTADNKLHFVSVVIGRDYGKEMDITSGLNGDETLVANPSAALVEGMTVQKVVAPPAEPAGSTTGSRDARQ